ncbi:MAG: hypothetical protein QM328_11015, partial [Acidobacteriota bacterium]|nr:hypothetical protein [Acidobacteriota bacterium]
MTTRSGRSRSRVTSLGAVATYIVLAVGAVTMLTPLVWMLSTSLKQPGAVFVMPPEFIPRKHVRAEVRGRNREVYIGADEREYTLIAEHDPTQVRVAALDTPDEDLLIERQALRPKRQLDIQWSNYPEAWKA